jgi:hypothetical protein
MYGYIDETITQKKISTVIFFDRVK